MKKKKTQELPVIQFMEKRDENTLFALCGLLFIGIFYSTAITTISTLGIVIFAAKHFSLKKVANFVRDDTMMPFMLVFLSVFLSGSYSDDQQEWLTALRVKLPFLILPFAIYIFPAFRPRFILTLHYWLIGLTVIVGMPVLFYALGNQDEMVDLIGRGQSIPTPIEHVKYSMFNAYAAIAGLVLIVKERQMHVGIYQWILGLSITFILVLMHVLAVRTGLLILYVSIFVVGLFLFKKIANRKYVWIFLAGAITLPIVALNTIPSLKQKIGYMKYDWKKYLANEGEHYSDSERMMSYKAGVDILRSNPVIGVGYGDVRSHSHFYYDKKYDRIDLFKLPHSQFLLTMAGGGILAFIIFIAGFYTPLLRARFTSTAGLLFACLYLNYSLSFFVENSLERSISVGYFVILALFLIKSNSVKGHNKY